MRISDWSSDVCSSDLPHLRDGFAASHTAIARLGHLVLNVADFAAVEASLVGKLNFLISDHVPGKIAFLRAFPNRLHHSFAIFAGPADGYNHVNFMVSDIDDVWRPINTIQAATVPIVLSPGRHDGRKSDVQGQGVVVRV